MKKRILGFFLIMLGIGMFCFGISMFTYQGNNLSELVSQAGKYSFFLWIPTIAIGLVLAEKKSK